jgi:hypothetical protein
MSIEAARTGYLYVVDQEIYADGSKSEPSLIFPTTRTRSGDNSVKAGRVIEIPAQDDAPPYFTLKRTRADHVGENVIVLVTPTPIESLTITDKPQDSLPKRSLHGKNHGERRRADLRWLTGMASRGQGRKKRPGQMARVP